MYECRSCVYILGWTVGHFGEEGAFRALERGYAHWASGRLQELQVNANQFFCHVKCTTSPSMKGGIYKVYMLLGKEGDVVTTFPCPSFDPQK